MCLPNPEVKRVTFSIPKLDGISALFGRLISTMWIVLFNLGCLILVFCHIWENCENLGRFFNVTNCSVLYCIVLKGWSLHSNALRLFHIYCAPPNLGIRTRIFRLDFAQRSIFLGLMFFNEPEIPDTGPPA